MAPRRQSYGNRFMKMLGLSFVLHSVMAVVFSLNPWPYLIQARPNVYTVDLVAVPAPEPEIPKAVPVLPPPPPPPPSKEKKIEPPKPVIKVKPIEKVTKEDIVEKVKKPEKEEKVEEKKVEEKKVEEKVDLKRLEEALEEVRKKAALDEIKKRIARREKIEKIEKTEKTEKTEKVEKIEKIEEKPPVVSSSPPPVPSQKALPKQVSAPRSTVGQETKLQEYYGQVWARIQENWTIPENLFKETVDLETIIIIIIERDGRVRKIWFEKKSGDDHYDQSAFRAIKKAEPLPPIPSELGEASLEIGIRFYPD